MPDSLPTRLYEATRAYLQATREGQETAAFMARNRAQLIAGIFSEAATAVLAKRAKFDDELPPAVETRDWFSGLREPGTSLMLQVQRAAELVNKFYLEGQGFTGSMRAMAASLYGFELVRYLMTMEGISYGQSWPAANQAIYDILKPQTPVSVLLGDGTDADVVEVGRGTKQAAAYINRVLRGLDISDTVTITTSDSGYASSYRWSAYLAYQGQRIDSTSSRTRKGALERLSISPKFWDIVGKQVLELAGYREPVITSSRAGKAKLASDSQAAKVKAGREAETRNLVDKLFAEKVAAFLDESRVGAKVIKRALADADAKGRKATLSDVKRHLPTGWKASSSSSSRSAGSTLRSQHSWHWFSTAYGAESKGHRAVKGLLSTLRHYGHMSVADYIEEHRSRRGAYMLGPQKPTSHSSYTLEDAQEAYKEWRAEHSKTKPARVKPPTLAPTTARVGGLTFPVEVIDTSKLARVVTPPHVQHPDLENWINNVVTIAGRRKKWVVTNVTGDRYKPTLEMVALSGGNKGSEARVKSAELKAGQAVLLDPNVPSLWFSGPNAAKRQQGYRWKMTLHKHPAEYVVAGSAPVQRVSNVPRVLALSDDEAHVFDEILEMWPYGDDEEQATAKVAAQLYDAKANALTRKPTTGEAVQLVRAMHHFDNLAGDYLEPYRHPRSGRLKPQEEGSDAAVEVDYQKARIAAARSLIRRLEPIAAKARS